MKWLRAAVCLAATMVASAGLCADPVQEAAVAPFRKLGGSVGFDEQGTEIVRVPFFEPAIIRAFEDPARATFRHNTT